MKKIQLTDGLSVDIKVNEQSEEVIQLLEEILKITLKSGLKETRGTVYTYLNMSFNEIIIKR